MRYVRANPSTQQTNTALLAGPPSPLLVVVEMIYVSSDTELTVSLLSSDSDTDLFKFYVGARGGAVLPVRIEVPHGQGIKYSTSAPGNVYLMVGYEIGSIL